ncbi:MAG: hypothetical protein V7709_17455 [Halioglobus sp.]
MAELETSFFQELSRRRVIRVLSVYLATSFVLLQVADVTFEPLGLPLWSMRALIVLLLLGGPVVAVLSWVFDITPEGVVRTAAPAADEVLRLRTGRKIDGVVIAALLVVITSLVTQGYFVTPSAQVSLAASSDRSVAVLPFTNIGTVADSKYFAEGLSVELINTLSMIPDLRVSSGNSSLALNTQMNNADIGKTLKVAHLVRGSVRKANDLIRVSVNVVRVADDTVVWTNTFEHALEDVFALQDEISRDIAISLKSTLYTHVLVQMAQARTHNVQAYDVYLTALHHRRAHRWAKALEYAKRAIELDPQYTAAYALAARTYLTRLGGEIPAAQAYPEARRLVSTALALEPAYAPAIIVMALLERSAGNFVESERLFREVKSIAPGIATQDLANLLISQGRLDEALEEYRRSYDLDPLGTTFYTSALVDAGDYEEAVRVINISIELGEGSQDPSGYLEKAYILVHKGDIEEASRLVDLGLPYLNSSYTTAMGRVAYLLSRVGREEEARVIVAGIEARAADQYISPAGPFYAYAGLNDADKAFEWLDKVIDESVYLIIVGLLTSPRYDGLRLDPRFDVALARLGLQEQ